MTLLLEEEIFTQVKLMKTSSSQSTFSSQVFEKNSIPVLEKNVSSTDVDVSGCDEVMSVLFRLMPELAGCVGRADSYTPEEIVQFLTDLPPGLGPSARFQSMKELLEHRPASCPTEIMAAAAIKLVILHQELNKKSKELDKISEKTRWRLDLLDKTLKKMLSELAQRNLIGVDAQPKYSLDSLERVEEEITKLVSFLNSEKDKFRNLKQVILTKMDEMTGVIVFFDAYQAHFHTSAEEEDYDSSLPVFLDNEAALRLLDRQKAA